MSTEITTNGHQTLPCSLNETIRINGETVLAVKLHPVTVKGAVSQEEAANELKTGYQPKE